MITINLKPWGDLPEPSSKGPTTLSFSDTVMTLDGGEFDLSEIPDGADVEYPDPHFKASRDGDDYTVTIRNRWIHGAPEETRFPSPITVTEDGPVTLPPYGQEE